MTRENRTILLTMRSRRAFGVMLMAAALLSACSAVPTGSRADSSPGTDPSTASPGTSGRSIGPTPAGSPFGSWVASTNGATLTVTLDRNAVAQGEIATFTSTFRNGTNGPIAYVAPECGGASSAVVSVPLPVEPRGRTWSGIDQEFKDYVLTEGYGPGGVPAMAPAAVELRAEPCDGGQSEVLLKPGESTTSSLPWNSEIVTGVDAPAGNVSFAVSVAYNSEGSALLEPTDRSNPPGPRSTLYDQIVVTGTIEVVGEYQLLPGMGEVIDAVLADEKFGSWLAAEPSTTWSNANLFLTSRPTAAGIVPAGAAWELDLFREMGVPRHWAIAFVDPVDGTLRSITYCDIPCDR